MNASSGVGRRERASERGGARLKFLIVLALIAAIGYTGYQYVPVAYQAYLYKDAMQANVDKAVALGRPTDWAKDQLRAIGNDYDVPPNADITVEQRDGRMEARVRFTRPIVFPGYTYLYTFDHTARSGTFLSK